MSYLRLITIALVLLLGAACSQRSITADPGLTGEELDSYINSYFSDPGLLSTQSVDNMARLYNTPNDPNAPPLDLYYAEGCGDPQACPMGSAYSVAPLVDMSFMGVNGLDALFLSDARVTLLKQGDNQDNIEIGLLIDLFYNEGSTDEQILTQYFSGARGNGRIETDPLTQRKKFEIYLYSDDSATYEIRLVTYDLDSNGDFNNAISVELWDDTLGEPFLLGKLSTLVGFYL